MTRTLTSSPPAVNTIATGLDAPQRIEREPARETAPNAAPSGPYDDDLDGMPVDEGDEEPCGFCIGCLGWSDNLPYGLPSACRGSR